MSKASKRRVGVLISGRGSNMMALLDAAAQPDFPAEIVLALANKPEAGGLEKAAARGVQTACVNGRDYRGDKAGFEAAIDAKLRAANVELVCLAGFMRIFTPWFTERWAGRVLNIHPSLLPSFPGLDTHARALEAGVKIHGVSVHLVDATLDGGPILAQAALSVGAQDTPDSLAQRVLTLEHQLYPATLRRVCQEALPLDPAKLRPDAAPQTLFSPALNAQV